jgi:hypothetical protein
VGSRLAVFATTFFGTPEPISGIPVMGFVFSGVAKRRLRRFLQTVASFPPAKGVTFAGWA